MVLTGVHSGKDNVLLSNGCCNDDCIATQAMRSETANDLNSIRKQPLLRNVLATRERRKRLNTILQHSELTEGTGGPTLKFILLDLISSPVPGGG